MCHMILRIITFFISSYALPINSKGTKTHQAVKQKIIMDKETDKVEIDKKEETDSQIMDLVSKEATAHLKIQEIRGKKEVTGPLRIQEIRASKEAIDLLRTQKIKGAMDRHLIMIFQNKIFKPHRSDQAIK